MKILYYSQTNEVLAEVGRRIKELRISVPLTQEELAQKAGVSLKTISNVETGKDVTFSTIIDILRALDRLSALDQLLPETSLRPSQLTEEKPRERAGKKKKQEAEESSWKWGDEQ